MSTTPTPRRTTCRIPRLAIGLGTALLACTLLAGCSILGAVGSQDRTSLYALDPRIAAKPDWPQADWQLAVSQPVSSRVTDSFRISVRPTPDEVQVYKGAAWAKRPSEMLEDTITRTLEDSGRIAAIARQGSGIAADYKLITDIRRFDADYANGDLPTATIEVNAKLLRTRDQAVVGSRTFLRAEPAATTAVDEVVNAFSRSLETVAGDMAGWVLVTGNAARRAQPADSVPADPVRRAPRG